MPRSWKRQNQPVLHKHPSRGSKGSFIERVYEHGNEWFGDSTIIEENSNSCNQTHLEDSISLFSQQTNSTEIYQVKWLVFSNPMQDLHHPWASSHWPTSRTNLQIPEIFPFPFRISGVLRSLWCHYFTPKNIQVNNPLNFAKSFDASK